MGKTWDILPSVMLGGGRREGIDASLKCARADLETYLFVGGGEQRGEYSGRRIGTRKGSCELCVEAPAEKSTRAHWLSWPC